MQGSDATPGGAPGGVQGTLGVPQGASQPRAEQNDATELFYRNASSSSTAPDEFSDGEIDWEAAATEADALAAEQKRASTRERVRLCRERAAKRARNESE